MSAAEQIRDSVEDVLEKMRFVTADEVLRPKTGSARAVANVLRGMRRQGEIRKVGQTRSIFHRHFIAIYEKV